MRAKADHIAAVNAAALLTEPKPKKAKAKEPTPTERFDELIAGILPT